MADNKKAFLEYLSKRISLGEIDSYKQYVESKLGDKLKQNDGLEQTIYKLTGKQLFEIDDIVELEKLLNILNKDNDKDNDNDWHKYSSKYGHGIPNAIVVKHYKNFLETEFIKKIENDAIKISGETEKKALVKVRLGQSKLRNEILNKKKECEICKIKNAKLLIISHIKPWAKSDDSEKLNEHNILLLCPMHDALFDKGLISFDENGKILISPKLDKNELELMNIDEESHIKTNSEEQTEFLKYHRKNIFIK